MAFVEIGALESFPPGEATPVRIGARQIAIYNVDGRLFAVKNVCPHEGDPLHRAPPEGHEAVCKSHGWRYDLWSGECTRGESRTRVAVYAVKIKDGKVSIDL